MPANRLLRLATLIAAALVLASCALPSFGADDGVQSSQEVLNALLAEMSTSENPPPLMVPVALPSGWTATTYGYATSGDTTNSVTLDFIDESGHTIASTDGQIPTATLCMLSADEPDCGPQREEFVGLDVSAGTVRGQLLVTEDGAADWEGVAWTDRPEGVDW